MSQQNNPLRILVVGCGNMGASHATAYLQQKKYYLVQQHHFFQYISLFGK